jgi:hypothetical protein
MPANVNVELSQDDALMLADACLTSMYHYRRLVVDAAELGSTNDSELSRSWIEQIKYWRDLYSRLFTAAVGHEPDRMRLPDISSAISSATRRFKSEPTADAG